MIKKLERAQIVDTCGNIYGYHDITEREMVDKINEIIDVINKGEQYVVQNQSIVTYDHIDVSGRHNNYK